MEGRSGGAVDVPISIAGATGIGALQFEIIYDASVIKAESATVGPLASNALVDFNPNNQGRLIVGIATLEDITGDGVVATARFSVVGQPGQTSALTMANAEAWEGASHDPVLITIEDGKLAVVAGWPSWLLWAAVALALLIGLMLLFFVRRRRRTQPAAAAADTPTARPRGPYCSACGSLNEPDAAFCANCGQSLSR